MFGEDVTNYNVPPSLQDREFYSSRPIGTSTNVVLHIRVFPSQRDKHDRI
jgi:hypothetical protein